jgi:hypothetical protein
VVEALEPWQRAERETRSHKTKLAEAIRWVGLTLFLDDGHIEIDNNTASPPIRPKSMKSIGADRGESDRRPPNGPSCDCCIQMNRRLASMS